MRALLFIGILSVAAPIWLCAQTQIPRGVADPPQLTNRASANSFKDLHGSWEVAKATMNGKESRDPALLQGQWEFRGNELLLRSPQKGTVRFVLKLDPEAKPRAFQVAAIEPPNSVSGWMLFARENNTLRIAFNDNLQGRPAAFESSEPSEPELIVLLLVLKK